MSMLVMVVQNLPGINLQVGGTTRNYKEYVPKNLGAKRPLLISCHGMNQDANYQANMLDIKSVADTAKFVTVFPEGIDKGWDISGRRDINFVLALIDEMVKKYDIDPGSVYLSGFSMGGMFTYHAMNIIADRIAAFAPISGYPMGGATAKASVRPIPIIHTHGNADDVVGFSGVQGALNAWINHNNCAKTPRVTAKYRNASHITRYSWGGGKKGTEIVLMEMDNKGHWISNDNGVNTGEEIWKFCKKYYLGMKEPSIRLTAPVDGAKFVTFGGTSEIPDLTLKATVTVLEGKVDSVMFYDGKTLIAKVEKSPYTCTLIGLTKGKHTLRAELIDDQGRTASDEVIVQVVEQAKGAAYSLHSAFIANGSVPEGWAVYDGSSRRNGFNIRYEDGSRLLRFTGSKHDFNFGLYTRNSAGKGKKGFLRFADKNTSTSLTLNPGSYKLTYRVVNWNKPKFTPITVAVETVDGKEVYSETYTPTVNIGNAVDKAFSGSKTQTTKFDIAEKGRYVITFYTEDTSMADIVLGQSTLTYQGAATGIETVEPVETADGTGSVSYYNLSGQPVENPASGLYIERRRGANGSYTSRKVLF